jgi:hypothetical protein
LVKLISWFLLVLGGWLCVVNFYLSFLRYPLHRLRRRPETHRFVSGIPVFGSAMVLAALIMGPLPEWAVAAAWILIAVDTGGIHWFIAVLAWAALRERRERTSGG